MESNGLEFDVEESDIESSCASMSEDEQPIFDDSFEESNTNLFWQWHTKTEESISESAAVRQQYVDFAKRQKTRAKCINRKTADCIVSEWENPLPTRASKQFIHISEPAITIYISVAGFRVVNRSGKNRVEFNVLFHDGDILYAASKCFSEFLELYKIISCCHNISPSYGRSVEEWVTYVKSKKKWLRCLDTDYLIEKSNAMGRFLHAVLLESPSPGLLFEFIQNSQACIETRASESNV